MNRKLKISLITFLILALVIAIPLIILSLARIDVGYVALSYDNIIANYSSAEVYGPGLYFIGVARQFIRIKQIPTILNIETNTYTTDYFKLRSRIILTYALTSPKTFSAVDKFHISFGPQAQNMIKSIVSKKIVSILSQNPSSYYQFTTTSTIQSTISSQLGLFFLNDLQTSLTITVLIESLVIDGVSSNTESVTKQIEHALRQLQRAQNEKIELSQFIKRVKDKSSQQLKIAYEIVKQRTDILAHLIDQYGGLANISTILFGNQLMKTNYSYASSQLTLRPELYILNSTTF